MQHYVYSSFGKLIKTLDAANVDISGAEKLKPFFTYTNREYDSESGLYYYRARYYDVSIGRFLEVDPHPGITINPMTYLTKYAYSGNDPINKIDPTGESFLGISDKNWIKIGIIVTAVATGGTSVVLTGALVGAGLGAVISIASGNNLFSSETLNAALKGGFNGATTSATAYLGANGSLELFQVQSFYGGILIGAIGGGVAAGLYAHEVEGENGRELALSITVGAYTGGGVGYHSSSTSAKFEARSGGLGPLGSFFSYMYGFLPWKLNPAN